MQSDGSSGSLLPRTRSAASGTQGIQALGSEKRDIDAGEPREIWEQAKLQHSPRSSTRASRASVIKGAMLLNTPSSPPLAWSKQRHQAIQPQSTQHQQDRTQETLQHQHQQCQHNPIVPFGTSQSYYLPLYPSYSACVQDCVSELYFLSRQQYVFDTTNMDVPQFISPYGSDYQGGSDSFFQVRYKTLGT